MTEEKTKLAGPDLAQGVEFSTIRDGTMLLGHAQGEPVLLARRGDELFAIGAICTHYGAPLERGLLVGDTVRCPWHYACFSLRTGEALRAPALDPVSRWRVEQLRDPTRQRTQRGTAYVQAKLERAAPHSHVTTAGTPGSIIRAKDIAPSTALRKWFGHDPARWREFRARYAAEVNEHPEQLDSLRGPGKTRPDHARLLGSRRSSQRRRRTEELSFGTTDETRNQDGSPIRLNSRVGP